MFLPMTVNSLNRDLCRVMGKDEKKNVLKFCVPMKAPYKQRDHTYFFTSLSNVLTIVTVNSRIPLCYRKGKNKNQKCFQFRRKKILRSVDKLGA